MVTSFKDNCRGYLLKQASDRTSDAYLICEAIVISSGDILLLFLSILRMSPYESKCLY